MARLYRSTYPMAAAVRATRGGSAAARAAAGWAAAVERAEAERAVAAWAAAATVAAAVATAGLTGSFRNPSSGHSQRRRRPNCRPMRNE